MYINNTHLILPNEDIDISKYPNYFEESEFISNLMLNPQKYREFKRNINRINNIDNEKNYLRSLERKNEINFLDNIIITEEEYQRSLKDEEIIFENINEERINDLLTHKKLLSYEKHLMETMAYFLGYEYFDWNMFKRILNLYDLKTKMRNIDYSKLKKKRINVLLGQLCRSDKFNQFLNMNDFCDSGVEFVYEWVKAQLKIYFYLYKNKRIPKMYISKSMMNIPNINQYYKFEENNYDGNYNNNNINAQDIPEEENDNETINSNMYYNKDNINNKISNQNSIINNSQQKPEIKDSYIFKNSTNIETSNYYNNNNSSISYNNNLNSNIINNKSSIINSNNNFINRSNSLSNLKYNQNEIINNNKSSLLLTSLPYLPKDRNTIETNDQSTISYRKFDTISSNLSKKAHYLKEARKVSFKLRGFNKEKEKLLKEIRTAEMLPLLKNRTFPQMRNYFEEKVPFSKKVEQRMKMDINYFSLNGTQDENKMISLIASGKMKAFNLESLFKLRNMLKS